MRFRTFGNAKLAGISGVATEMTAVTTPGPAGMTATVCDAALRQNHVS